MAEYLGGVLAASRSRGGRDDRAIAWSNLVTSLSSVQVRAHFLLYREWAALLRGRSRVDTDTRSVIPNLVVDTGSSWGVMAGRGADAAEDRRWVSWRVR